MSTQDPLPRRIVVFDEDGASTAVIDDVPSAVITDPARPGYQSVRYWSVDSAPARLVRPSIGSEEVDSLQPPPNGAILRVYVFPPDATYIDSVTPEDVAAYFASVDAPHASTYSADAPHPYMQRLETLDFCMVISGEITLVLDEGEVDLKAGDTVVQRGTNHAWSNRSDERCLVVISSHDARTAAP